jgi:signal peptidase I
MAMEPKQRSELACELVAEVAHSFGEVRLKVTGASMIPSIWPGDVIIVRREAANLQPGKIVLYRREGRLVAHRITCIRGNLLSTRGDSLPWEDPPIPSSDIVGQVISVVRHGCRVHLKQSVWQRAVSSTVRHSDFCLHMMLRVGTRWRSFHGRASRVYRRAGDRH